MALSARAAGRGALTGVVPRGDDFRVRRRDREAPNGEGADVKIQTLGFVIMILALMMAIFRDPAGRVGLIVFLAGIGTTATGLAAVMALFQTIGSIGLARGLLEHAEAVAATTLVLVAGTAAMSLCIFAGAWCIRATLP